MLFGSFSFVGAGQHSKERIKARSKLEFESASRTITIMRVHTRKLFSTALRFVQCIKGQTVPLPQTRLTWFGTMLLLVLVTPLASVLNPSKTVFSHLSHQAL